MIGTRACLKCGCKLGEEDYIAYEVPSALLFYCKECSQQIGETVNGFLIECIPHNLPNEARLFADNCETCEFSRENTAGVIECQATSFGRKAYRGHGKCGSYLKEGLLELDGRG